MTSLLTRKFSQVAPLLRQVWIAAVLAVLLVATAGCQGIAWLAQGIAGPEKEAPEPAADYVGLTGKTVAVIVSADERTLFSYPDAPQRVTQFVSARLVQAVPGIQPLDPRLVSDFQRRHADWIVVPYVELARELKVDRLVHINLAQYTTHEPGNKELWQGIIRARVGVAEADGKDPSNFVYTADINVTYPPDRPMGILNSDEETIQLGMLRSFSRKVAARFRTETAATEPAAVEEKK